MTVGVLSWEFITRFLLATTMRPLLSLVIELICFFGLRSFKPRYCSFGISWDTWTKSLPLWYFFRLNLSMLLSPSIYCTILMFPWGDDPNIYSFLNEPLWVSLFLKFENSFISDASKLSSCIFYWKVGDGAIYDILSLAILVTLFLNESILSLLRRIFYIFVVIGFCKLMFCANILFFYRFLFNKFLFSFLTIRLLS